MELSTKIVNASSSLLFIISTIQAFYVSKLTTWKIFNSALVVISFLCNATTNYEYDKNLLFLDYLNIYLLSITYINHSYINTPYSLFILYEYIHSGSIINMKNLAFITAILKCMVQTYLYVDKFHFYLLVSSSLTGIGTYEIRYIMFKHNNMAYILPITYIFHGCITAILYVSSITAK